MSSSIPVRMARGDDQPAAADSVHRMGAVVTSRASRMWVAICGIAGVAMLTAHFYFPSGVPSDNAPSAVIIRYVLHHHTAMLATTWLQGFGPLLYVLFALGLVYLAGGMARFWGWLTMLSSAVILTLSLIDAAFTAAAAQAAVSGHAATTAVSIDLIDGPANDAIGRMFLIAPPLLLPIGAVLLGSRLLPRTFAWAAVAFGAISVVLGLAALFSAAAFSAATALIVAQNLWVLTAALILLARGPSAANAAAPAPQAPQASRSTAAPADHKAAAPHY
jgi:hypothetical protein